ncbi:hypothetical protein IUK39_02385 [Priestia aryabhattai]|nr:hypothetical protein [Priestia aryabhattai]
MHTLPQTFCDTITHLHSHKGQKWLTDFPQLIRYCEQRWHITIHSHFPLSYHFVAPARKADGSELVVKFFIEPSELLHEFVEELNLSKKRILLWGYAHSVLATCWLIEDRQDAASFLRAIEAFQHLFEYY